MAQIVIDSHQHFWTYGSYQTSWMEMAPYAGDPAFDPIRRSFTPADLAPQLAACGIGATIIVEAADFEAENVALAGYADAHDWVAGVVGWVPLDQPDRAAIMLDMMGKNKKFVGVRHLINVEPDPDWILRPEVLETLKLIAGRGLSFDYVGILPRHLENAARLAEQIPGLKMIIDHLGKPPIIAGNFEPWASLLRQVALAPNVFAKISGLDAGGPKGWSARDLAPYIDHALNCFGPARLMFGSDWPVADLRGGYGKIWRETNAALGGLSSVEKDRIFGGTAIEAYRLQF